MITENLIFSRRPLSGGVVNSATEIRWTNGEKVVYEKTPTIPEECLLNVRTDANEAKHIGFRQIQISQDKFVVAQIISKFISEHNIEHSNIVKAREGQKFGSAFIKFVEGETGDKVAENNPEIAWSNVGFMLARLHQLPTNQLAEKININFDVLTKDNWLHDRFSFLMGRLKKCNVDLDFEAASKATNIVLGMLPKIDKPICITYDDPKPASIIFKDLQTPVIIDMEGFTIGHRIIDGLGRGLYWGPLGLPISRGWTPDPSARVKVLKGYNQNVAENMAVPENQMDMWCLASELFWLPDIIGVHLLIAINNIDRHQVGRRLNNFKKLIAEINADNIPEAIKIALS